MDEFPELSGADRSRRLYIRDRIAEMAENAIADATEDAANDGEPGLPEGDAA